MNDRLSTLLIINLICQYITNEHHPSLVRVEAFGGGGGYMVCKPSFGCGGEDVKSMFIDKFDTHTHARQ